MADDGGSITPADASPLTGRMSADDSGDITTVSTTPLIGWMDVDELEETGSRYPALGGSPVADLEEPRNFSANNYEDLREKERETLLESERKRDVRKTKTGERQPSPTNFDVVEKSAYSPERNVYLNGTEVNADRDITIRAGETGVATLDLTLWNLDAQTWASVRGGAEIEVEIGWQQTETPVVFRGSVITKRRRSRAGDSAYVIRGLGRYGKRLKGRYTGTFNDISPHRIVEYIAEDVGIGKGYISSASEPTTQYYALSKHKTLKSWFNRLAEICQKQTGLTWVWYIEEDSLHFHPKQEQVSSPIELSYDKSILRATPVGKPKIVDEHNHEIIMRAEPMIRRGTAAIVEGSPTMSSDRVFQVTSYTVKSSTTRGTHETTATFAPLIPHEEVYQ